MLINKIVIAEDDDAIAHMVSMALGDAGFLCLRARDGEEALNLVRMHAPDLLVLDVMMPRVDGIEVTRRLKSDVILSRTPILMITAMGSVDNKVQGLEAGADDYLVKPFDLRELGARVKALLRAARRERERNPTTDLPGSGAIETHIEQVLARGQSAAIVHFDVREFDRFADEIGYSRAEEVVAALGTLVLERARARSGGAAFVGHLGGADFIAVTAAEQGEALAADVIEGFATSLAGWIDADPDPAAWRQLAMAVAVAPTAGVDPGGSDRIAERLAAAMRVAKRAGGSSCVVWSPEVR
jgi:DNA-binding response OmpR family regulator